MECVQTFASIRVLIGRRTGLEVELGATPSVLQSAQCPLLAMIRPRSYLFRTHSPLVGSRVAPGSLGIRFSYGRGICAGDLDSASRLRLPFPFSDLHCSVRPLTAPTSEMKRL
jgi:hypothetical protein